MFLVLLILKVKLVPPSLPQLSYIFVLLVDTVVLVLVYHLCPFSVRVVATFPGTVLFLYYVLCSHFFPNTLILFFI